ncbi:hypothetical protein PSPL106493_15865 [Pseudomonas plecoglossicida]
MTRPLLLLGAALLFSPALLAQQIQRQLGDFDFKLGTSASRTMAQGLISPSAVGAFHGGLDLSHPSGWYFGQPTSANCPCSTSTSPSRWPTTAWARPSPSATAAR